MLGNRKPSMTFFVLFLLSTLNQENIYSLLILAWEFDLFLKQLCFTWIFGIFMHRRLAFCKIFS